MKREIIWYAYRGGYLVTVGKEDCVSSPTSGMAKTRAVQDKDICRSLKEWQKYLNRNSFLRIMGENEKNDVIISVHF